MIRLRRIACLQASAVATTAISEAAAETTLAATTATAATSLLAQTATKASRAKLQAAALTSLVVAFESDSKNLRSCAIHLLAL